MKKIIILSVTALFFVACGNSNNDTQKSKTTVTSEDGSTVVTTVEVHNAKNSLDYKGTYTGELPTASGTGMKVKIELGDNTYKKEVTYNEQNQTYKAEGTFRWDNTGNIITLLGVQQDEPSMYRVGENTLTQLDMDGKDIVSNNNYTLRK